MNIHISEKNLFNSLNNLTISKFLVGSHLYNLNNEKSDEDFLSLYILPVKNKYSFLWEHHQLQYKENNIDFNFSTLQSFIRNIISGDATINFELLFSEQLKNDKNLKWIYNYRYDFINYNVIKSYLGLAKRDLNIYLKISNNCEIKNDETNKKLFHFCRGIIFSNMLLNGYFNLDLTIDKNFIFDNYSDHEFLESIKNNKLIFKNKNILEILDFKEIVFRFENKMNEFRKELNNKLDNKKINKFMDIKKLKLFDEELIYFSNNFHNDGKIDFVDFKEYYYSALENGLKY